MKRFLIPHCLAAVSSRFRGRSRSLNRRQPLDPVRKPTLFERFRLDHKFTLARHSSTRSHSSHSSHSSHRSSAGGGYVYRPPAVYQPSPPPAPAYQPPAPTYAQPAPTTNPSFVEPTLPALAGNTARFRKNVMDVQTALAAFWLLFGRSMDRRSTDQ